MNREDVELYVTGNFDGDVAAFEAAIAKDPALAETLADEARFETMLRDAMSSAQFCPACDDVVRPKVSDRCDTCGAASRPGGYTVERVLVSNAHGRMYLAHDADGRQVALKELAFVQAPSVRTIEAFEREAKFLRALEHPAIPRFVASFEEGRGVHTRYYLAQELVQGTALDQLDDHWYTEAEILDVARQVLAILVYLQSLSPMVIHRDIKPANLIKRADGQIALVDFGAAYVEGTTAGITTIGTFGYMPVEQLAGIVDATTDLFALGSSLLYLLTRQEPWRLAQTKTAVNASPRVRAFLDKLVATNPRDRFPNAKEALAALDRPAALAPKRERTWLRPALIASGIVLAAGGGSVLITALNSPPDAQSVSNIATLRIALPAGVYADMFLDDKRFQAVQNGLEIPISGGFHRIKLVGTSGAQCEQEMTLPPGKITTIECAIAPEKPEPPRLESTKLVDWSYKQVPFHDVVRQVAETCGFNVVVPDSIGVNISAQLTHVPCREAFESLLESQGLWYTYSPDSELVRIAPRRELDVQAQEAKIRALHVHVTDELPRGRTVKIDFKNAPIRDVLHAIAGSEMNLIVPDYIDGAVTIRTTDVPWEQAFESVLQAQGLWYRYKPEGHIIRIAPRKELDVEDQEARERRKQ